MTVADLIDELRRMPNQHAPVKVVLTEVYRDEGDSMMNLCDEDAIEADEVRNEGAFVLIRSK